MFQVHSVLDVHWDVPLDFTLGIMLSTGVVHRHSRAM